MLRARISDEMGLGEEVALEYGCCYESKVLFRAVETLNSGWQANPIA